MYCIAAKKTRKKDTMKNGHTIILIAVAILVLLSLLGCSETSRKAAAERRWDRTLERARLEAAQAGIKEGRLAYARHILEDCIESQSSCAEQAAAILAELQKTEQQIAQARLNTSADQSRIN